MKRKVFIFIVSIASICQASLYTGQIVDLRESSPFYWGDGVNDLYQEWSVNYPDSSGWFYGSFYRSSNADVYVYSGLTDPMIITNASGFSYFDSSSETYPSPYGPSHAAWAREGDTVFFKGTNGFYGAWHIENIHSAALDGTWYFLDDGSSDFSVPEPTMLLLLGLGGLMLRRKR